MADVKVRALRTNHKERTASGRVLKAFVRPPGLKPDQPWKDDAGRDKDVFEVPEARAKALIASRPDLFALAADKVVPTPKRPETGEKR